MTQLRKPASFLHALWTFGLLALAACSGDPLPHEARREIQQDLLTLDKALTRFASTKGRYAGSIEELLEAGLVEAQHLTDPYGRRYAYLPASDGRHDLLCYGKDGRPGGEGDNVDIDLAAIRSSR